MKCRKYCRICIDVRRKLVYFIGVTGKVSLKFRNYDSDPKGEWAQPFCYIRHPPDKKVHTLRKFEKRRYVHEDAAFDVCCNYNSLFNMNNKMTSPQAWTTSKEHDNLRDCPKVWPFDTASEKSEERRSKFRAKIFYQR